MNSDLFSHPGIPFKTDLTREDQKTIALDSIAVRGVSYSLKELTDKQRKLCSDLSVKLSCDLKEVLRVFSQANLRLRDSENKGNEREHVFYFFTERLCVVKLQTKMIQRDECGNLLKSESILSLISDTKWLVDWILSKPHINGDFDSLIRDMSVKLLVEMLHFLNHMILKTEGVRGECVAEWFQLMADTAYLSVLEESDTVTCLATSGSLLLLDLSSNFGGLDNETTYLNDSVVLDKIHESIKAMPVNAVVLCAWAIALHRKMVVLEQNSHHVLTSKIFSVFGGNDGMGSLLEASFARVQELGMETQLLKCHNALNHGIYAALWASLLTQILPYDLLLDVASVMSDVLGSDCSENVVMSFFSDPQVDQFVTVCRAKLPLSLKEFTQICRINAGLASEELSLLKTYMAVFPAEEFARRYEVDDKQPDLIRLTVDTDVFPPFETRAGLSLVIPRGTVGQIIPTPSQENVCIAFVYHHDGWALLGRALQRVAQNFDQCDKELVTETFKLLANTFSHTGKPDTLVTSLSKYVEDSDVIQVSFHVLEQAFQCADRDILKFGMEFLKSLVQWYPQRIWLYVCRSPLVGRGSSSIGGFDTACGHYSLTLSLVEFVGRLAQAFATPSINVVSTTLVQLLTRLVEVFETSSYMPYSEAEQNRLRTEILRVFTFVLETRAFLAEPVSSLVEAFSEPNSRSAALVIGCISQSWETSSESLLKSALLFSRFLLESAPRRSPFFDSLFALCPSLSDIYSLRLGARTDVLSLASTMVKVDCCPSMLAHMGSKHVETLLSSLACDLRSPLSSPALRLAIFEFFTAVNQNNQQGMTIKLIKGEGSILSILKDLICLDYPEPLQLQLLSALAAAYNSWMTASESPSDFQFTKEVVSRIKSPDAMGCKMAELLSLLLYVTRSEESVKLILGVVTDSKSLQTWFEAPGDEATRAMGALITSCLKKSPSRAQSLLTIVPVLLDGKEPSHTRVELAFFIAFTVFSHAKTAKDAELLPILTALLRIFPTLDRNSNCYIAVLRILLVSLEMLERDSKLTIDCSALMLDLFHTVVAKGSCSGMDHIQSEVLNDVTPTLMNHMGVFLSLLKKFLSLNFSPSVENALANSLEESGTIKYALSLYASSHRLIVAGDPVLAGIALRFIFEMVSLKVVAEKVVSHGLFSVFLESPISSPIEKGHIMPFGPNASLHRVWSQGILSIVLTLVGQFGERILSQVCVFVTHFSKQISSSLFGWYQKDFTVTTAGIQETGQLVMLRQLLSAMKVDEFLVNSGLRSSAQVPETLKSSKRFLREYEEGESVQFMLGVDTREQRISLANVLSYLVSHPKYLSLRVGASNAEEQRNMDTEKAKFVDRIVDEIRDLKDSLVG